MGKSPSCKAQSWNRNSRVLPTDPFVNLACLKRWETLLERGVRQLIWKKSRAQRNPWPTTLTLTYMAGRVNRQSSRLVDSGSSRFSVAWRDGHMSTHPRAPRTTPHFHPPYVEGLTFRGAAGKGRKSLKSCPHVLHYQDDGWEGRPSEWNPHGLICVSNTKCVFVCVRRCAPPPPPPTPNAFVCVSSPNAFTRVSPNASAESAPELASLAHLCSLHLHIF